LKQLSPIIAMPNIHGIALILFLSRVYAQDTSLPNAQCDLKDPQCGHHVDNANFDVDQLADPALALLQTSVQAKRHSATSTYYFGNPDCPCIGLDAVFGTAVAKISSSMHPYPADIGAHCTAWDNDRYPSYCGLGETPGKDNGWCADAWCYVDPCNCNIPSTPVTSSYFPSAKYLGKTLYYSYGTCGATDQWTATEHANACVNQNTSATCTANTDCAWAGGKCGGKEVMGQCGGNLDASTWGASGCRCIGVNDKPGAVLMNADGQGGMVTYPADAGASCQAWDMNTAPSCSGSAEPKAAWCYQSWCYVDPCSCNQTSPPKTSSYLPNVKYQGKQAYYSYETCSGQDLWTASNHGTACVNQMSETDCVANSKCGWTGTECLGKEVAAECANLTHY